MNQYCSLSAFLENIGVLCTLRAPGVPLAALTNGDRGISRFAEGRRRAHAVQNGCGRPRAYVLQDAAGGVCARAGRIR